MPYVTFSDLQKDSSFDFIVVGAGSAGCPLASRLSEDLSVTVLLIEAGPRYHSAETTINAAIPAGCGKLQHSTMDWAFFTEPLAPNACLKMNTYQGCPPERKNRSFWPRGKGMGGSSLINYMAWVRGHPNDYNEWETKHGAKGWGWKNGIEKLFEERIEDTTECDPSRLHNNKKKTNNDAKGPLGISHKQPVNPLVEKFLEACQEVGLGKEGDYNRGWNSTQKSIAGVHQTTVRQGTRCTSARAYIDPLMATDKRRPNLTVLTGAQCEKVITQTKDGKIVVTGVKLVEDGGGDSNNKKVLELSCTKEVILSAGALGSPQILLQSGIGPNGSTLDSPQVGQNLQDHLVASLRFQPKLGNHANQDIGSINGYKAEAPRFAFQNLYQMLFQHKGMLTSSTYDASVFCSSKHDNVSSLAELMSMKPNLQLSMFCSAPDKQVMVDNIGLDFELWELDDIEFSPKAEAVVIVCTLLHPKSRGYVTLKDGDDSKTNNNNGLAIHANYLSDPEDVKDMVACLKKGIDIASASPFQDLIKTVPFSPKDLSRKYNLPTHDDNVPISAEEYPDAFWEEFTRRHATTLYHPAGTCRMGTSKEEAVVDHNLKVFGVEGLRVADASIQPEVVSGNTQASCVVIGEKAADIIRDEYNLKSNPQDLLEAVVEYEDSVQRKRWMVLVGGLTVATLCLAGGASVFLGKMSK
ncbi:Alcohol dehydrogenase [acceptor] [Seminavis robusta]|uniref:Alcohol dehydrogenase [acceptor] n=1 Tax=Seminavis robusta TaxID=568900 RepID=A0A9N8H4P3_9STRA|nr:Alcohol dehydrogenase [acceptor] [Seminavis robusta]|eukprot:Sro55_g032230.1 Alcohol dehydrogenase [acceptor] (693) ;mRNA; r:38381-40459